MIECVKWFIFHSCEIDSFEIDNDKKNTNYNCYTLLITRVIKIAKSNIENNLHQILFIVFYVFLSPKKKIHIKMSFFRL